MFDSIEEEERKEVEIVRYFDLETKRSASEVGWDNIDLMYMSLACVYCEPENEYRFYTEDKVDKLISDLFEAHRVVGYNTWGFDYQVLSHYTDKDLWELPSTDMMLDINDCLGLKRSKNLDNIASSTLGIGKTADGLKALEWWRKYEETGDDKYLRWIAKYCKGDVVVTKDVYKFGLVNSYLNYTTSSGKKNLIDNIRWTIRKGK
jgi:DEAD/DEAH box helicase domain-containing protein